MSGAVEEPQPDLHTIDFGPKNQGFSGQVIVTRFQLPWGNPKPCREGSTLSTDGGWHPAFRFRTGGKDQAESC